MDSKPLFVGLLLIHCLTFLWRLSQKTPWGEVQSVTCMPRLFSASIRVNRLTILTCSKCSNRIYHIFPWGKWVNRTPVCKFAGKQQLLLQKNQIWTAKERSSSLWGELIGAVKGNRVFSLCRNLLHKLYSIVYCAEKRLLPKRHQDSSGGIPWQPSSQNLALSPPGSRFDSWSGN